MTAEVIHVLIGYLRIFASDAYFHFPRNRFSSKEFPNV